MKEEDAEALIKTLRDSIREVASADYAPNVIESWAPTVSVKSIQYVRKNPENEVRVVAELDGQIVGIGSTVVEQNQLRACYVSPEGFRKGVGTAIVETLEEIARENGVLQFELHATVTAEPFYNHLGYISESEYCIEHHLVPRWKRCS